MSATLHTIFRVLLWGMITMVAQYQGWRHSGAARYEGGGLRMGDAPQMGLCIIRAEVQGDHLLITINSTSSVTRTLRPMHGESVRHFVDIDKATKAVAEFLREFAVSTGGYDT
jgi:hypothetical protein